MERDSSLKHGNTSGVQACQRQRTQNQYNTLLSNMEVDIEAQKNFTDKLPIILTTMTQHDSRIVHCTAFVRQMTTVQDYM